MTQPHRYLVAMLACITLADLAVAQQGPGRGRGFRGGRGPGGGPGHVRDDRHDEDHEVFQFLLTNHKKINRKVTELPNGVETLTESDEPEIAAKIQEHVTWMEYRIKKTNPIRMRDPLFAELFRHTDKITMKHEDTTKGVRVIETSKDAHVVKLIQAHAKVVSGFVNRGFAEAMKNHSVPGKTNEVHKVGEFHNPQIKDYGAVVTLPKATHQPKNGSRILVDVTRAGDMTKLLGSVEKLARFVNIYAGAGTDSASVQISVIFHGNATLCVLNDDAYAEKFGTAGNPNFECLHRLHESGVELIVCGQSLAHKKGDSQDVVVFADVAVSALTTMVNLQSEGYAYVPLK